MQQKSFSIAYLFCCSRFFIYLPSLLKLGYATERELPSREAMFQVSVFYQSLDEKKNMRMLEKSAVI